jgi:integrase
MPKITRRLTEAEIKNAKPRDKDYKLYDEAGLYLLVRSSGTRVWRLPYRMKKHANAEKASYNTYTLGQYPEMGSSEARKLRDEIKAMVREGINPNKTKEAKRLDNLGHNERTFEYIAREWFLRQTWVEKHRKNIERTFEKDVFPRIGSMQIDQVTPRDIIGVIEEIAARDAPDVAQRISQHSTKVFDYAINKGLCDYNPAQGRSAVIKKKKVKHRPHLHEKDIPEFLEKLESYQGGMLVQLALKLLLYTFVRPGELRNARWEEFSEAEALWRIPAHRMKMNRPHTVPLSKQALKTLKELRKISGHTDLLFPGQRGSDKPISDVTMLKAFKIMGYVGDKKIVPHGMRGTASTILNENGFNSDVIEYQLAHLEKNKTRRAYNHSEYLEDRKTMMQWYADKLDAMKTGGNAVLCKNGTVS